MTREEQIREAGIRYDDTYCTGGIRDAFESGAEWADANQPNPWISVEDKLPDDGVLVIVAYHWWRTGKILYASDVFHIDYGWEGHEGVVAWMPIPELPEEDGK